MIGFKIQHSQFKNVSVAGSVEFLGGLEHLLRAEGSPGIVAGEQGLEFTDDLHGVGFSQSWKHQQISSNGIKTTDIRFSSAYPSWLAIEVIKSSADRRCSINARSAEARSPRRIARIIRRCWFSPSLPWSSVKNGLMSWNSMMR